MEVLGVDTGMDFYTFTMTLRGRVFHKLMFQK